MRKLKLKNRIVPLDQPVIMGILNTTPDSFFDGGKYPDLSAQLRRVEELIEGGAQIIDVGGESTRPDASQVSTDEEKKRVLPIIEELKKEFPEIPVSIDTYKPAVAEEALERGVELVNDISGGLLGTELWDLCARYGAAYVLMHFRGHPPKMEKNPQYDDVVGEVYSFLEERIQKLKERGVREVIADPGFGFGKTVEQNYELMAGLQTFKRLRVPLLVGISRKSMIWKVAQISPAEALPATSFLNGIALLNGADILRVHDPKAASQVVKVAGVLSEKINSIIQNR